MAFALLPQAVSAQSLNESVMSALKNHPQIETSQIAVESAKQDEKEQHSAYFPQVSASATGGRIYGDNATSRGLSVTRGSGYSYLWEGSFTGRQMIWDNGEAASRIESAQAGMRAAQMNLLDVREQLAFQTVQAYVETMRARNGLDMVRDYRAQVNDYLGRIRELVEQGAADEAELQQARDVMLLLGNFEADYEGQLEIAQSDLIRLTGKPVDDAMSVPPAPVEQIPPTVEQAIALAHEYPAIAAAKQEVLAAAHGIDAERSAYFPDVNGEVSYLKSDKEDIIGGEVVDARALVRVNWDFATGGALKARVKRSKLEEQAAKARVEEIMRTIEREVRFAYAENETARKMLDNQRERLDLNQKLFDTYKTQFEGAVVPLLQVMQADNQLFNARLETMNAQHRYVLSQYRILGSVGKLQEALGLSGVAENATIIQQEHIPDMAANEQAGP